MLQLTAKQLFASFNAMAALVAQKIKSPRLAYNLAKTWKAFQEEAENLQKCERSIYENFGAHEVRLENGNTALSLDIETLDKTQQKEFEGRRTALQLVNVELWGHPLTLAEIEENNIELSPAEFAALDWLIVEAIHEASNGDDLSHAKAA